MAKRIIRRTRRGAYLQWVKALESGKYSQGVGKLKSPFNRKRKRVESFCCLGVLCELARIDGGPEWSLDDDGLLKDFDEVPPKVFSNFMGLTDEHINDLIDMNDEQAKTFPEIAEYIRNEIMPEVLGS